MSASDRLRTLDDALMDMSVFGNGEHVAELQIDEPDAGMWILLRNALPQIVAIAEAAEKAERYDYCDSDDGDGICSDPDGRWAEWQDIGVALAALDEALQ